MDGDGVVCMCALLCGASKISRNFREICLCGIEINAKVENESLTSLKRNSHSGQPEADESQHRGIILGLAPVDGRIEQRIPA